MNSSLLKKIFPFIAVLMLSPWPIAYAHDVTSAEAQTIKIEAAPEADSPRVSVFGKAISSVKPGDLYYLYNTNQTTDFKTTLYLTNTEDLVSDYKYVILKIGLYVQNGSGSWEKVTEINGKEISDKYLTLQNAQVSFNLAGGSNYKLTIESGAVNCVAADSAASRAPAFFVEVY